MLSNGPCSPSFSWIFTMNGCWILSQAFSSSDDMFMWPLIFHLFRWWGYIYSFVYVKLLLYLWDEVWKKHGGFFFNVFLNSVCKYFMENFCVHVHKGNWSVILFLHWVFL